MVSQSAACLRNSAGVSIRDLQLKSFNWEIASLVPFGARELALTLTPIVRLPRTLSPSTDRAPID
jgi:hypothetical protein